MFNFRDLSIRTKLSTLLIAVVVVVLLLSTATGVLVHYRTSKTAMQRQVEAIAEVLAEQSRAGLQFRDHKTANEVLAPLWHDVMIVQARTFDAEGNVFADYSTSEYDLDKAPALPSDGNASTEFFAHGHLHVFREIQYEQQVLGYIHLEASLASLHESLGRAIAINTAVFAICVAVVLCLGHGVHRLISEPIRELAEASGRITAERDYSVRVKKQGQDELGTLFDAFNTMLTEIQRRDLELERGKQQFQAAVEWAPMAMIMIDAQGTIVLVNVQVEKLFGYDREELLGQSIEMLMPERFRESHPDIRRSYLAAPAAQQIGSEFELFAQRRDGGEFPIEVGLGPIETLEGVFALAAIADITKRKNAEDAIRRINEELEQRVQQRTQDLELQTEALTGANNALKRSNEELEGFAYISSHDLQEPLRKVQAFGNMLASKFSDKLGDEGQDYIRRMQNAADRMQTLINDLLELSRVTRKGQPFVPIDIDNVVQGVLEDLEISVAESGGTVTVCSLPKLQGDAMQMRQLFQNLIGNAFKYRRSDVPPVVAVKAAPRKVIDGAAGNGDYWDFEIRDNGIGFKPQYADQIFQPFKRLVGRSKYEGTGIGLAICRKIVERHKGTIRAEGRPGEGASFFVSLPVDPSIGVVNHVE